MVNFFTATSAIGRVGRLKEAAAEPAADMLLRRLVVSASDVQPRVRGDLSHEGHNRVSA